MLFPSFVFLLFAAAFFLFWPLARRATQARYLYLVVFSFFFYGWATWWYLGILIVSGLIDFWAGLSMQARPERRKSYLGASLAGNLGVLAFFKYLGFGIDNLNALLGDASQIARPEIVLPVGISFFTFQSMSYTIDVYKGQLTPTRNVLHFFAYLSMFPQLVAGPIERASHLLPQLEHALPVTAAMRWDGLRLIASGYFKKTVIADNLAPAVAAAFGAAHVDSGPYWWVAIGMFAIQIYCDFSGYSDIARGLARWMGYDFMANFSHPYCAVGIRDFWARWHISLSTWFRDYVYVPLGGSRKGKAAADRNMWITMLVSGFWHGAAWTFVIWGALHALFLTLERHTRWPARLPRGVVGTYLGAAFTLPLVLIAWVAFRAEGVGQMLAIYRSMLTSWTVDLQAMRSLGATPLLVFAAVVSYHAVTLPSRRSWTPETGFGSWGERIRVACMLFAILFFRGPGSEFIYFAF